MNILVLEFKTKYFYIKNIFLDALLAKKLKNKPKVDHKGISGELSQIPFTTGLNWYSTLALPKRFVPKSVSIFGNLVKISNISGNGIWLSHVCMLGAGRSFGA